MSLKLTGAVIAALGRTFAATATPDIRRANLRFRSVDDARSSALFKHLTSLSITS